MRSLTHHPTTTTSTSMHRTTGYSWANSIILMGVFTVLWGTIATMYMPAPWTYIVFAIIGLTALALLAGGIALLGPAKRLRGPTAEEAEYATRRGRIIGISFGTEILLLAAGFPLLALNGLNDLMAPFGALVVGLHFLPFALAFERKLDYFIGGWTVAWAVVAVVMIALSQQNTPVAWTLLGLACCLATIAYGAQMFVAVRRATLAN